MEEIERFWQSNRELFQNAEEIQRKASVEYNSEVFLSGLSDMATLLKRNPRLKDIRPDDATCFGLMKHIQSIVKGESLREDMDDRYIDALNYILILRWQRKRLEKANARKI